MDIRDYITIFGKRHSASHGVLNFRSIAFQDTLKRMEKIYQAWLLEKWPNYVVESVEQRRDPQLLFPWAKSIIIYAFPFRNLPVKRMFLPKADRHTKMIGYVAGYGGRVDYHLYAKRVMTDFVKYAIPIAGEFKHTICVDQFPLAERSLAAAAGVGDIGNNACLVCKNEGSGCYIASIVTDLDLENQNEIQSKKYCHSCNHCLKACPNKVFDQTPSKFSCAQCRSFLTMDRKGPLNADERPLLGKWIFGCDLCTGACSESKLPETIEVDIAQLLTQPTSHLKKAIQYTPLDHVGPAMLLRNAIYAVAGHNSEHSQKLIKHFAMKTGSGFLRSICVDILKAPADFSHSAGNV